MNLDVLKSRIEPHQLRQLDVQFSVFIQTLSGDSDQMGLAAFLASYELGKGNVCLDLSKAHDLLSAQELTTLYEGIKHHPLVYTFADGDEWDEVVEVPFVLSRQRLYLQRYFHYEHSLAEQIKSRLMTKGFNFSQLSSQIQSLFLVSENQSDINWQAAAACTALNSGFSVISGGPGTGKTTTVIRLLALMIQGYEQEFKRTPIIKLAAPTGKAAMRLTESITRAKAELQVESGVKALIPQKAETLHRLLKRDVRGEFKFNAHNPLHLDVLIVDEASMVDLPLMTKLIQAIPEHGKIILLGDKDQLASVEAGSVLADICDNENGHGFSVEFSQQLNETIGGDFSEHIEHSGAPIRNHICQLKKSYRFHEDSGIGHLARAANAGDIGAWNHVVRDGIERFKDIQLHTLSDEQYQAVLSKACDGIFKNFDSIHDQGMTDEEVLNCHKAYSRYQILCALKEGSLGVAGINLEVEKRLKFKGRLITESKWYSGRPIIILENDYGLNLYNGDMGILLPQKLENGGVSLKATFIGADEKVRWVQPSRLPKHDTVYAMTVHKSQGSEFEHCTFILPNYNVPILSKELIYTGITRAKKSLTLLADEKTLKIALEKRVQRASGLGALLWHERQGEARNSAKSVEMNTAASDEKHDTQASDQFSLF